MKCVSFQFTSLCCILQRHSSLDSSRNFVSSTLAARISDLSDMQLNLLTLAPLHLTNCDKIQDKTELLLSLYNFMQISS